MDRVLYSSESYVINLTNENEISVNITHRYFVDEISFVLQFLDTDAADLTFIGLQSPDLFGDDVIGTCEAWRSGNIQKIKRSFNQATDISGYHTFRLFDSADVFRALNGNGFITIEYIRYNTLNR